MLSLELVDIPLIFSCPADHVPDWQPYMLLGMVETRSVNVKNTHAHITNHSTYEFRANDRVKFPPISITLRTS